MRMKVIVLGLLFTLAMPAFSQGNSGGEGNNTNCNGVGNVNSPCAGNGGNGGGTGGGGGAGGSATATVTNSGNISATGGSASATGGSVMIADGAVQTTNNNNATIAIGNGGSLGPDSRSGESTGTQSADGTTLSFNGNATAPFSNANYVENNSEVGDVSATSGDVNSTNTNTATGGDGGSVGNVTAAAVVESGAVQIAEGALQSNYNYKEVQQAPAIGQGSFAIYGCNVGGNAGGSGPGWAGFLGFGFTPEQCYDFMLAQAYQSIGEKKAVCDILRNSKAGKRQADRGITLPECLPEAKPSIAPMPVPVDLSPYATKEELNRAFRASQAK